MAVDTWQVNEAAALVRFGMYALRFITVPMTTYKLLWLHQPAWMGDDGVRRQQRKAMSNTMPAIAWSSDDETTHDATLSGPRVMGLIQHHRRSLARLPL